MKVEILCSGITGKIYVAQLGPKGSVKAKLDVTQQVINAVMQHMHVTKEEYECRAGELIFKPKESKKDEASEAIQNR